VTSGALPTFLVIGCAKCGTTALHEYLALHPEIQMSRPKELQFFTGEPRIAEGSDPRAHARVTDSGNWDRGLAWYRSQFDPDVAIRGESSPQYASVRFPDAPERIASTLPDARLVFCVRDPVERVLSAYRYLRLRGSETRPIAEALQPGANHYGGGYASRLAPYLERFPRERILIVEAERLDGERRETLAEVLRFLGADPAFWSPEYERRWNVTDALEHGPLRALTALRQRSWWQFVANRVPERALRPLERVQVRAEAPPGVAAGPLAQAADRAAELPAALLDELRDDAARFRELVGLDFPDWSV
jgi:hypothetical protein